LLPDTAEILWTNGTGVKLGFQDFSEFCTQRERGLIKPLQFGRCITDPNRSIF